VLAALVRVGVVEGLGAVKDLEFSEELDLSFLDARLDELDCCDAIESLTVRVLDPVFARFDGSFSLSETRGLFALGVGVLDECPLALGLLPLWGVLDLGRLDLGRDVDTSEEESVDEAGEGLAPAELLVLREGAFAKAE
jgi:hypothetical protein